MRLVTSKRVLLGKILDLIQIWILFPFGTRCELVFWRAFSVHLPLETTIQAPEDPACCWKGNLATLSQIYLQFFLSILFPYILSFGVPRKACVMMAYKTSLFFDKGKERKTMLKHGSSFIFLRLCLFNMEAEITFPNCCIDGRKGHIPFIADRGVDGLTYQ